MTDIFIDRRASDVREQIIELTMHEDVITLYGYPQNPYEVLESNHPAWDSIHPSGFGAISRIEEGDIFRYNATKIAETTQDLTDSQLRLYVAAIHNWWDRSTWWFSLGMKSETVVLRYCVDKDTAPLATFFGSVMASNGCKQLIDWLAPERKEAV